MSATITNPPEGFHRVFFDAAGTDGLGADTLTTAGIVNRVDETPIADAGPTRFARVGGAVQLDGGESKDPDRVGFSAYAWRVISGPGGASFRYVDEERVTRDGYGKPVLDDDGLQQGQESATPNAMPRFEPQAAGKYVIGLKVTDKGGHVSTEDTTEVYVMPAFDAGKRVRLDVSAAGGTVKLDARDSNGTGTVRWISDAKNPTILTFSPIGDGRVATFAKPAAGTYFIHCQIGDSYPATAVVRVDAAGVVTGSDYARPPRFWAEDAVMYMVFPREFKDSDGDGRGDFLGIVEKLPYLKSLGVNALWMMPITPGPTSHGYAATAHFDVEEDYGTLADWDAFTDAAHAAGMQIVFDLVANHTSNRHPFFQAAEQNVTSPLRDLYVFNANGTYEYAFDFATLPSWNYNNPVARQLFLDVVDFWMDHGVDSFRADIAGFVPPSFWRNVRRHVRGRSDAAMLLAEIVPPSPGFFDGDQFDLAYDANLFWNFKDVFATTGGLDAFDGALDAAESFITDAIRLVREKQDPRNVLRMRYLDNQDEDRFLLKAGRSLPRQRAAAGVLLTLPGVPMIFYGDETGAVQMRGPMKFDANLDMQKLYRRLLAVRNGNAGLRGQDSGAMGSQGDSFTRMNSDNDTGGYSVYSFARYREGQRFLVLVNRFDASVLGTQVKYWPPPAMLTGYPESRAVPAEPPGSDATSCPPPPARCRVASSRRWAPTRRRSIRSWITRSPTPTRTRSSTATTTASSTATSSRRTAMATAWATPATPAPGPPPGPPSARMAAPRRAAPRARATRSSTASSTTAPIRWPTGSGPASTAASSTWRRAPPSPARIASSSSPPIPAARARWPRPSARRARPPARRASSPTKGTTSTPPGSA